MRDIFSKKGQVTIFIIIAIFIVASVVLFFTLRDPTVEEEISPALEDAKFRANSIVEECLEDYGREAIFSNALRGNHYILPEDSFELGLEGVVFYKDGDDLKYPSDEEIEKQIRLYLDGLYFICLGGLRAIEDDGFEVSYSNQDFSVLLREPYVEISAEIPISILRNETSVLLEDFSTILDVPWFFDAIALSRKISDDYDGGYPPARYLEDLSQKGLRLDVSHIRNGHVFSLINEDQKHRHEPFELKWGVRV